MNVSQILKDNHVVIQFYSDYCPVKDLTSHKTLLKGALKDGQYQLDFSHLSWNKFASDSVGLHYNFVSSSSCSDKCALWHQRLGHPCISIWTVENSKDSFQI